MTQRQQQFQTDFARPSGLPTASLGSRNQQRNPDLELDSDVYLERLQEEWNRKIDEQVQILVDNMGDIVQIASIGSKDHFRAAQEQFQTELKAESMVMAATSLLSLTHSMKLMFLLSDEEVIAQGREQELQTLRKQVEEAQQKAFRLWDEIQDQSEGNGQ